MTASTILSSVRQPLATALAGVAGNVYAFVPETVIPPAVVIVSVSQSQSALHITATQHRSTISSNLS